MSKEIHAEISRAPGSAPQHVEIPIVELRQYVHVPGKRDEFVRMLDEYFIEEQERYGSFILGHFRNRAHPDRFAWLRGYTDMQTRWTALHDFYQVSPLWQEHRAAVNATISDIRNVLLLRPARASTGFHFDPAKRPTREAPEGVGGMVIATIYTFATPVDEPFVDFFESTMAPLHQRAGATLLGHFITEPAENTYTDLPVREGENVFVWFASFADEVAYREYHADLKESQEWNTSIVPALQTWGASLEETLELLPTRRSLLRHAVDAR